MSGARPMELALSLPRSQSRRVGLEWLLTLRFLKVIAVVLFAAGALGAVLPSAIEDRRRAALWLGGPGFGLTWVLGFMLAWTTGISLLSTFVWGAMALSFLTLNGMLYAVGKENRRSTGTVLFVVVPLVLTFALMVWRPA